MRWTTLRRINKLSMQAILTFVEPEEDVQSAVKNAKNGLNKVFNTFVYFASHYS
ncbi:hypothetical protein [Pradoshia eiseniae]|uniref:hypothetical protein n=1 Tax=Pradoshia eiseniae TaxID=2064768 RepID=UPI00191C5BE3|nr:hypothetical protein [Pradoshia eiseniae]